MAGNKFGCPQVPELDRGWGRTTVESKSRKTQRMLLDFCGVDSLSEQRIVFSLVPSKPGGDCPQSADRRRRRVGSGSTTNSETPHDRKDRTHLELLIFTAGNPPEGQQ
jgi:hypothetical protein